jgi:glutamine---fructose-6-phosphate transaminase (isomerizing)
MATESRAAATQVAELLRQDADLYRALGSRLRHQPPVVAVTVARGSSDHAAQYLAYLVMSRLGTIVASLPMSLVTLYASPLRCQSVFGVAFSQSGQSPDLVAPLRYLREGGACAVAAVNDVQSPLAQAAELVLPLHAGPELSVAATKSFIAQLVVAARLVAHWQDAPALQQALERLPADLALAAATDWSAALQPLHDVDRLFVIGRGPGLAVAQEMALKFKETCGISAEAFSGAEVEHGPMALVGQGFAALVLACRGPAQAGLLQLADKLRQRGARVLVAAPPGTPHADLALVTAADEALDPIVAVQSFYPMVEVLARVRGHDPDAPRHLNKVTLTR